MKLKNTTFAAILFSFGLMTFSLTACNETQAGNQTGTSIEASPVSQIPQLKGRKAGLGNVDEITHVASVYDTQKALLKEDANNADAWLKLAELFVNEARISGDHPYYYPAALQMIASISNVDAHDAETQFEAASLKASVLLSQHEFEQAREVAKKAVRIAPMNAGIHGALVDAEVELGNYDKAVEYSDKMVSLRPDLRSYSRISYLREIHGDPEGAIEAMEMAVKAGMPGYEQTAWCRLNLAKLNERYGRLDQAEMHYTIVLEERPNYPFATAGLASVEMKKGNMGKAEELLDKAIEMIPEVSFYEMKAELYKKTNREKEAKDIVAEVLVMMAEDQESGHKMDLELAAVQLRLKNDPEVASSYALEAIKGRPNNIDVNGLLAEIAYTKGDFSKAQSYDEVTMRTATKDPMKNIVSGLIKIETGNAEAGKTQIKAAFVANPYLSADIVEIAKTKI